MDHLFFKPDRTEIERRVVDIRDRGVCDIDPDELPSLKRRFRKSVFRWLGFDHDGGGFDHLVGQGDVVDAVGRPSMSDDTPEEETVGSVGKVSEQWESTLHSVTFTVLLDCVADTALGEG